MIAGAIALNFAGVFLYVAASPVFVTKHLGLGAAGYAWQFIPGAAGLFLGSFLSNRLSESMRPKRLIYFGYLLMISGAAFNVIYHLYAEPSVPYSILPIFIFNCGMSMIVPTLTVLNLDLFPSLKGTAASCQSFLQHMSAALLTAAVVPGIQDSIQELAAAQLVFAILGLVIVLAAIKDSQYESKV